MAKRELLSEKTGNIIAGTITVLFIGLLGCLEIAESHEDEKQPTNVQLLKPQLEADFPGFDGLQIQSSVSRDGAEGAYTFYIGEKVCSGLLVYFPEDIYTSRSSGEPDYRHSTPSLVGPTTCRGEQK